MSKQKDVGKISSTRKSSTIASKSSTSVRDGSTERKRAEKVEIPIKKKIISSSLTNVRKKLSESDKPNKSASEPMTSSSSPEKPVDMKLLSSKKRNKPEVPVTPKSSRVSKTQFFPSKNMYSHALSLKSSPISKISDKTSNKSKQGDSFASGKTNSVKKISSSYELPTRNSTRIVTKKSETENKLLSSKKSKPTEEISFKRSTSSLKHVTSEMKSKIETGPNSLESNNSVYTSPDSSILSERPRTATLKRGSIVNTNIVGPEAPMMKKIVDGQSIRSKMPSSSLAILDDNEVKADSKPSPKSETSENDNYEEDFESYESDFEQYSSSSSTNLDNITGETSSITTNSDSDTDAPVTSTPKKIISIGSEEERKLDSGHYDMSDYNHKHMLDNIKEFVEKENSTLVVMNNPASLSDEGFEDQKSLQLINFLDAKRKHEYRKSIEMKQKRGKEILSMIRLHSFTFTLFDLPPVPYDVFIKNYGASNTVQSASQTGEDNVEEEIQTEKIITCTKWTQIPICFNNGDPDDPNYWSNYKQDYLGVGGDEESIEKIIQKQLFDDNALNKFLKSAGDLIIRIQEEARMKSTGNIMKNQKPIPFSDGHILFNTSDSIFDGTTIKCVSFSCDTNNKVMTVHLKRSEVLAKGSVLAIWNICNSEEPEMVYISHGTITCCTFGKEEFGLVFAGLEDGTLSIWDTNRNTQKLCFSNNVPVHSTDIGFGHQCKIVALHPVRNDSKEYFLERSLTNEFPSDELNRITENSSPHIGELQCTDFVVNSINPNFAFISTNYGFIVHHLVKGGRAIVKKFLSETISKANCMDTCPFTPDYFLAGYENGNIHLYSRMIETPIMVLSDKKSRIHECSIELLQWSKNKPFLIYTKDKRNTIHIWDLSESDMVPIYSIPIGKEITCMTLSPSTKRSEIEKSYMMIGTKDGSLFLHLLNEEHGQQSKQIYEEHVRTFLNYVNRL
ncbi:uncharacterized protein [Leptinotarsa decemlineata]|uniref:uncharacterized protein n=1 Tax=Leptinotarsa decemlineata TaxID=7539 RepID=UPI003D30A76E